MSCPFDKRFVLTFHSDIIDAEAADGNVLKMLLGSINRFYDNDPPGSSQKRMLSPASADLGPRTSETICTKRQVC